MYPKNIPPQPESHAAADHGIEEEYKAPAKVVGGVAVGLPVLWLS